MPQTTPATTTRIVVELSEHVPGEYVATAVRDDGQTAIVESSESLYEAGAYALARVIADIAPVRS